MYVNWFFWFYILYYVIEDDYILGDESFIICDEGEVLSGDENIIGMYLFF